MALASGPSNRNQTATACEPHLKALKGLPASVVGGHWVIHRGPFLLWLFGLPLLWETFPSLTPIYELQCGMQHHCKKIPWPVLSIRLSPWEIFQVHWACSHQKVSCSLHRNSSTSFFGDAKDLKHFKVLAVSTNYHKIGSQNLGQNLPLPRNFEKSSARATSKFSRLLTSMKLVKRDGNQEKTHWETRDGYWEIE